MPRLFISHSSKDNAEALAFLRWLRANGFSKEDVFIDLRGIAAGEPWRQALRKANTACEAVLLLASPDSLDSRECQREMNLAEDLGKEILVAILKNLKKEDPRLARYADRQIVDLSANPTELMPAFKYYGKLRHVNFHLPALQSIKARLVDLGVAPNSFAWLPRDKVGPFPGLSSFTEEDAGIFFGREADIMAGLTEIRLLRKRRAIRTLVIQAASGAGKSSFLRAGLWPRLLRDPDFAPLPILRPAGGILTGPDGLGKKLAPWFERHGALKLAGDIHMDSLGKKAEKAFADLITEASEAATTARRASSPEARPPALLLAIDQGEELFASENQAQSQRFLDYLATILRADLSEVDLYLVVTVRADSVESLLQRWPKLRLGTPRSLYLPPLSPSAYRDVIVKPAAEYSKRVRRLIIQPALLDKLVEDSAGADALPLLAFTLQRLFSEFDGANELTLDRYTAIKGVGGSIDLALGEAQREAGTEGDLEILRRFFVPGLATWDPAANAAKRLVAKELDLTGEERSLASLANALVKARLLTRNSDTVEVAHETLLRRPPISDWLEERKDALRLGDDLLKEGKEWATQGTEAKDLVRRGERLQMALDLLADPDFAKKVAPAKEYILACETAEKSERGRTRRLQVASYVLLLTVIVSLVVIIKKEWISEQIHWIWTVRPYIDANITPFLLKAENEKALKPGEKFRECEKLCPEMVVIPAGTFIMGSSDGKTLIIGLDGKPRPGKPDPEEEGRDGNEGPQHEVSIERSFAVSRFSITFDDWDECHKLGGCPAASNSGWGRGLQPVINVSWNDAKKYINWLSLMTGKEYRLLSEAEWEYSARAGTKKAYSFDENYPPSAKICEYANFADKSLKKSNRTYQAFEICDDGKFLPAIVGLYKPNRFGLYDMHGNVSQWTEDCYTERYDQAPSKEGCERRVTRGGSWVNLPLDIRSASRFGNSADNGSNLTGFRIARTLTP